MLHEFTRPCPLQGAKNVGFTQTCHCCKGHQPHNCDRALHFLKVRLLLVPACQAEGLVIITSILHSTGRNCGQPPHRQCLFSI